MLTPNKQQSMVIVDVLNELFRRFGLSAEEAEKVIKGIKIKGTTRPFINIYEED